MHILAYSQSRLYSSKVKKPFCDYATCQYSRSQSTAVVIILTWLCNHNRDLNERIYEPWTNCCFMLVQLSDNRKKSDMSLIQLRLSRGIRCFVVVWQPKGNEQFSFCWDFKVKAGELYVSNLKKRVCCMTFSHINSILL